MKRNEEPCPEAEERGTHHKPHQKCFKVILPKFLSGSKKNKEQNSTCTEKPTLCKQQRGPFGVLILFFGQNVSHWHYKSFGIATSLKGGGKSLQNIIFSLNYI